MASSSVTSGMSRRSSRLPSLEVPKIFSRSVLVHQSFEEPDIDPTKATVVSSEEGEAYIPWEHRDRESPTTDVETFILLVKACVGTGIFAMPRAFKYSGLWLGVALSFFTCFVVTYCAHTLVKCSHVLCKRFKKPYMTYTGIAKYAFLAGPQPLRRWANAAGRITFTALSVAWVGVCSVFIMFVVESSQKVLEFYTGYSWEVRHLILMFSPCFLVMALIRSLRVMAVAALIANILMLILISCSFYYICRDLPSPGVRPVFTQNILDLPLFFSIAVFAMAEVGVDVALENNMKHPDHFIGWWGILAKAMLCIVLVYTVFGFFGYLKYGDNVHAMVTLDFPVDEPLAQAVNIMIAVTSYQTYGLQFYVTVDIIWNALSYRFLRKQLMMEYITRIVIFCMSVVIALAVPKIEPIIALLGAVCISALGLMLPPCVEIIISYSFPEVGNFRWVLARNLLAFLFGVMALVFGTWVATHNLIYPHEDVT